MNSSRVELTGGSETLGEVPMKRGIFQGNVLSSPLLFVIALITVTHIPRKANPEYGFQTVGTINDILSIDDLKLYSKSEKALGSLIQTVKIFSEDIRMQFGMKKRKIVESDRIQLLNDKVIKSLEERERCAPSR